MYAPRLAPEFSRLLVAGSRRFASNSSKDAAGADARTAGSKAKAAVAAFGETYARPLQWLHWIGAAGMGFCIGSA
jgi:hypothetical protein